MTETAVAYTELNDSREAGAHLGGEIARSLGNASPDALILFVSSAYDYEPLLAAVEQACRPHLLVGCSSAGEFASQGHGSGAASAVAIRSASLRFSAGLGLGLTRDRAAAARQIASSFQSHTELRFRHRAALVLTDALAGHTEDLIDQLNVVTAGSYRFFGGGAGDDARFQKTHVFLGTRAYTDAAVALEILSEKPIGIGVSHGWEPASEAMRVTEADGTRLVSLNATPVVEILAQHAEATGQAFDANDPLPFFLHNVLGIDTGSGFKLRVPLALDEDGSITCAAEIPDGSTVRIMRTSATSALDAAREATASALAQLGGSTPRVALFFDCAATRLRMGALFSNELDAVAEVLGPVDYAGCNSYGQIARSERQFSGFHNCTAVIGVIPE